MKYHDEMELKEAIKTILAADEEAVEQIQNDLIRREVKKVREMEVD